MLPNKNLNTVWLSELLNKEPNKQNYDALTAILEKHNIAHKLIKDTKDIWCRDYMPLQTAEGKFVQFRYEPSYLVGYEDKKTLPEEVCAANDLEVTYYKINLDGGNVVQWDDKALITDRIFTENPEYSDKLKLVSAIENLLEAEVIIIPQINSDLTGHADGLVRFLNSKYHFRKRQKQGISILD